MERSDAIGHRKIRIYHATNPIVSFEQSGVQVLAELDTTSVEFIHQLSDDWMLTSHYAIGLVDTRGNIQIDQFDVSGSRADSREECTHFNF